MRSARQRHPRIYQVHIVRDYISMTGPSRNPYATDYYVRASGPAEAERIATTFHRRLAGQDTWQPGKGGSRTMAYAPRRIQVLSAADVKEGGHG